MMRLDVPVGSTVAKAPVRIDTPLGTTIRATTVRLDAPVGTSVGAPGTGGVRVDVPVGVIIKGAALVCTVPVGTSVRRFAGTGVRRSPRRVHNPVRSGIAVFTPPPPPPPVDPPPPVTEDPILGHPFWTTPLASSAPLAATSSVLVGRLTHQATMTKTSAPVAGAYNAPGNTITNGSNTPPPFASSFALPIYRMTPGTPRVPVFTIRPKTGLQTVLDNGVPLPDPAVLPGGTIPPSGTDGSVVVYDTQTGELWELWQLKTADDARADGYTVPDGYDWVCTQGGKMANRHTHPGIWSAPPSWGVAASGLAKVGGMLTADDYFADEIRHPLGLSLPITGGAQTTHPKEPSKVLPATRFDRMSLIPGGVAAQPAADLLRVPEGARFRLPAAFDVDAHVAALPTLAPSRFGTDPDTLRKILIAVRDYGMVVVDTAGVVAFSAEHPKTFGTPYNRYRLDQAPVWGNFGQQIPWDQLVQVAAPTVDISVSGAGA